MAIFNKLEISHVGTVEKSTNPATEKSILISVNVSSLTPQQLPVSIFIRKFDGNVISITNNRQVLGNFNEEILKSGKILLNVGDRLCAKASVDNSFDIIFSLLGGIK